MRIEGDGYVEFEMDNTKFSLFERSKLPELIGREAGKAPCGEHVQLDISVRKLE